MEYTTYELAVPCHVSKHYFGTVIVKPRPPLPSQPTYLQESPGMWLVDVVPPSLKLTFTREGGGASFEWQAYGYKVLE